MFFIVTPQGYRWQPKDAHAEPVPRAVIRKVEGLRSD